MKKKYFPAGISVQQQQQQQTFCVEASKDEKKIPKFV